MEDDRLIERAVSTSSACLLPSLSESFDEKSIGRDDFNEFRIILDDQLHLLLDILYQNGNLLRDRSFDNQLTQLRVNIILLRCEQTADNLFFQTDQTILIKSLETITNDNMNQFNDDVFVKVIEAYKIGLSKTCWKKQFGMIFSFLNFCKILFSIRDNLVDGDILTFMLSVGSNLVSHYDPHYKTMGFQIYSCILKQGNKKLLMDLNICKVIYSESFAMLRKSSEAKFNEELYESLFQAVLIEEAEFKNGKWSKFDDVMAELLNQFGIESDASTSFILLQKIVAFCAIDYRENNQKTSGKSLETNNEVNRRTLRWLKKLMETIIRESSKLSGNSNDCLKILEAFHSIYSTSLCNVDPLILGKQLTDFSKKLVLILIQVSKKHNNPEVTQSVCDFLKTIHQHQNSNTDFVECIRVVQQNESFLR